MSVHQPSNKDYKLLTSTVRGPWSVVCRLCPPGGYGPRTTDYGLFYVSICVRIGVPLRRFFRCQLQRQPQVEANFAVFAAIQAFVLRAGIRRETPREIDRQDQDEGDAEGQSRGYHRGQKLDAQLSELPLSQEADRFTLG